MSLFQKSVERKYINELDAALIEEKYAEFQAYFGNAAIQENIRNSKEEQFQEGFLRELFVNILGYTINPEPNFNLTTELKNVINSKKVDGAILKGDDAIAVIELKGTDTTDLDKIETQAFGYKNHQPGCVYVITSNFEKLRFYIDNAVDHIDFDLFMLSREQFSRLWLCLAKDNLLSHLPKKMKDASLLKEEDITKHLYTDYSNFRTDIFANLIKNNPDTDKLILFKKTQKLLDRFLFIFFAEDRSLLPPNSISEIIKQWETLKDLDEYIPLYERFKKYFGYMNTGHKGKKYDIFAYNGGLFAPDQILDNIAIDDELLYKHTLKLSTYNFETDVDVNILGHIFEHSLNEIENVQAEIRGEAVDSQKSKRKKDGIFYTPKYITKYIVENTVGKLCAEKRAELGIEDEEYAKGRKSRKKSTVIELDKQLEAYREWLLELTIIDPACGSGAFLNQTLDFLIEEHRKVDELRAQLFGGGIVFSDITSDILEKNIYGVDLNEESVEIAKLSLWLRTAQIGRKLSSLNNNIKCGNSLIDDPEIAGDKAFDWQKEFPEVFAKGGFDVVVGNPPYVFARENFSNSEKSFYNEQYVSSKYQINTYILFIEKSYRILKTNGHSGLIIPNSWLMMYSGQAIREYLLDNVNVYKIINLMGYSFEDANVETVILFGVNNNIKKSDLGVYLNNGQEFYLSHIKNQNEFRGNEGLEFKVFNDEVSNDICVKVSNNSVILDEIVDIKAGLQAYEKGKGNPIQTAEDVKNRPYDYDYKFDENTYKYLEGKDVNRYFVSWSGGYLKYGEHLAAPRTFNLFSEEKIIVREITGLFPKSIVATYDNNIYLYNRSNIAIVKKESSDIDLRYILAILNSSLMSFYFVKNTAKSVRKLFPKIILKDLRLFPFKQLQSSAQQPFIAKADQMLSLNKDLQNCNTKFHRTLEREFALEKLSKKLEAWYELSYADFLKELKKQKIDLSLAQKAEWEDYFLSEQAKATALQSEINSTDKEIDQMVYELYGLTKEEIEIVEAP